ncbi:MAG: hypothetical protein WD824_13570 [Cyclobacteriaceae bacterium]
MARKNKKSTQPQQPLSPKKYILTRARLLPVYKCLVNKSWNEGKLASVTVTRKHSNGNITAGFFIVDMLALGVKKTYFDFNVPEEDFFEWLYESVPEDFLEEIPYPLAHNIIYGAVAFAEEHNMLPHHDFLVTQHILEEDTDDIELIDLTFGLDGKPVLMDASLFDEDDDIDEDEDDDIDEDEDDFTQNFEKWTDEDWRIFFNTEEAPDAEVFLKAIFVLFDRWFRENYPFTRTNHAAAYKEVMIAYDAIEMPYFNREEEQEESQKIYEALKTAKKKHEFKALKTKLHDMIAANPENPVYHNYLSLCARNNPEFRAIVENTVKKFPDYLFGKIALANLLLEDDKLEDVEKLFNNAYTLPDLYPDRKTFHITELIGFNSTMMRIFLRKQDIAQVNINCEMIYEMSGDDHMENSDLFKKADAEFVLKKGQIVMRYIREKGFIAEDAVIDR